MTLRVLVYTSLFPNQLQPDFGIFIKNRMKHFADLNNCEIVVVAPVPYCPPWKFLGKRYLLSQIERKEVIDDITVYHPKYFLIPKISMIFQGVSMFLSSISLVKKIKKKFEFDIIDAHYIYPDGCAGMLLSRCFKKPLVVSARGSDINQYSNIPIIKTFIRCILKNTQYSISVCKALKDEMVKLGNPSDKIKVIPNGIDIERFYPVKREVACRNLSISSDGKIILSVGALIERKGHHLVIEALKEITTKIEKVHLYIAGEGSYRKILEKKIFQLKLNRHVTLLGHIDNSQLTNWYSAADIFCLASSREGWANVIMESMACGTPVIATNVWGAPEIISNSDVGILVERNSRTIADKLFQALTMRWSREKIRKHVRNRSWDVVANEVRQIFRIVIEEWKCTKTD